MYYGYALGYYALCSAVDEALATRGFIFAVAAARSYGMAAFDAVKFARTRQAAA